MSKSKLTNYTIPTEVADLVTSTSAQLGISQSQLVRWLLPSALLQFVDELNLDPTGAVIRAKVNEAEMVTQMLRRTLGVAPAPTAPATLAPAPTAPAPTVPPAPQAPPAPQTQVQLETRFPDKPWPVEVIKRGPAVWFTLEDLCAAYKVSPDKLRQQIDIEDELEYMGKNWCDQVAITQLKSLCPDPKLEARVSAWAAEMQRTVT